MLKRLKQYVFFAMVFGGFYFLLGHHIIFTSFQDFDLLKKNELTLKYTFFSLKQASPQDVLKIDELRDAGIGELMVEKEIISEEELSSILEKIKNK